MPDVFQTLKNVPTKEQIEQIAKTGSVPTSMKGPEDKVYIAILKGYDEMYSAYCADERIDGYAIIAVGRKELFERIKNYIMNNTEEEIDPNKSFVMVEGVDPTKGINLTRFINLCNKSYPNDEPFYIADQEVEINTRQATGFGGNAGTLTNE
jgi:hypothetical protein